MNCKVIDVLGKPCPIPVIEAKKALAGLGLDGVLVKVDNIIAVQNLEKMAKGQGYDFSYFEVADGSFSVAIDRKDGKIEGNIEENEAGNRPNTSPEILPTTLPESSHYASPESLPTTSPESSPYASPESLPTASSHPVPPSGGLVVAIGRDTMGEGAEELGKILIKGFIYALSELSVPPESVIFFNSGARLTSGDANTIDDLKKLEAKGTAILTCGTCVGYYGLSAPAIGDIADMYAITGKMANAKNVVNI